MDALSKPPRIPYYASYVQFARVMELMKEKGIPPRVKSQTLVNIGVNADDAGRIVSGLKALDWIDEDYKPSPELQALVRAYATPSWATTLREQLERAYAFVPGNWTELTPERLHEAFVTHSGRDIGAVRSAETFFITASKEAGINLSSAFINRTRRVFVRLTKPVQNDALQLNLDRLEGDKEQRGKDQKDKITGLILELLGLVDDPLMNSKEREAVLVISSYLKRRSKL